MSIRLLKTLLCDRYFNCFMMDNIIIADKSL